MADLCVCSKRCILAESADWLFGANPAGVRDLLGGVNLYPRSCNGNKDTVVVGIDRERVGRGRNECQQLVCGGIHHRTPLPAEWAESAIEVAKVSVVVAGVVPDLVP